MGQKVNPILLRLQYSNRHFDNFWYSNHFYAELLSKDLFIQQYLNTFLKLLKLPSTRLSIQHSQKKTKLYTFFCYPKQSRELRSKFFQLSNVKKNDTKKYKELNSSINKNCLNDSKLWPNYKYIIKKKFTNFYTNSLLSIYLLKKKNLNNFFILKERSKDSLSLSPITKFDNSSSSLKIESSNNKLFQEHNNINYFNKKLSINFLLNNGVVKNTYFANETINKEIVSSNNKLFEVAYNINLLNKKQQFIKYFVFLHTLLTKYNKNTSILTNYSKLIYPIRSFQFFFPKFLSFFEKNNLLEKKTGFLNKKERCSSNKFFSEDTLVVKKEINNTIPSAFLMKNPTSNNTLFEDTLLNPSFLNSSNISLYNNNLIKNSSFVLPVSNIPNFLEKELKYKNYIERYFSSKYKSNFEFVPFKIYQDWQHAGFLADEIVYFLERRVPFRRIKSRLLKQISENSNIRGVRITCSGRVGGKSKKAQRAKIECVKYGQTSLHVFTSQIDYAVRTAHTIFGSVGIKVWICYN